MSEKSYFGLIKCPFCHCSIMKSSIYCSFCGKKLPVVKESLVVSNIDDMLNLKDDKSTVKKSDLKKLIKEKLSDISLSKAQILNQFVEEGYNRSDVFDQLFILNINWEDRTYKYGKKILEEEIIEYKQLSKRLVNDLFDKYDVENSVNRLIRDFHSLRVMQLNDFIKKNPDFTKKNLNEFISDNHFNKEQYEFCLNKISIDWNSKLDDLVDKYLGDNYTSNDIFRKLLDEEFELSEIDNSISRVENRKKHQEENEKENILRHDQFDKLIEKMSENEKYKEKVEEQVIVLNEISKNDSRENIEESNLTASNVNNEESVDSDLSKEDSNKKEFKQIDWWKDRLSKMQDIYPETKDENYQELYDFLVEELEVNKTDYIDLNFFYDEVKMFDNSLYKRLNINDIDKFARAIRRNLKEKVCIDYKNRICLSETVNEISFDNNMYESLDIFIRKTMNEKKTDVISANLIYSQLQIFEKDLFNNLGLETIDDLYAVLNNFLKGRFYISKPLISTSQDFDRLDSACNYLRKLDRFNKESLDDYFNMIGYQARISYEDVLNQLSKEYVRVDLTEMIKKKLFCFDEDVNYSLKKSLDFYFKNNEKLDTKTFRAYVMLPSIKHFQWNKYMLVGIIKTFYNNEYIVTKSDLDYLIRRK